MTFPEGMGMKVKGAKKVRLIGDEEPKEEKKIELPSWVEDEPSYGRDDGGVFRGQYLAPKKPPKKKKKQPLGIPDPIKKRTELVKDKRPERRGGIQHLSSTNIFGLTSRSESMYPEAYRPILTEHWEHASDEEYNEIIRRQAMVNKVVSFRENATEALDLGVTDAAYEEATGRRNQAMRRRRKPRNYEERKRFEEEDRKAPLSRRYMSRDAILENSAFVATGPLDAKVLVPGFAGVMKEVKQSRAVQPARRKKRKAVAQDEQEQPTPTPVPKLPSFNKKGPRIKQQLYRNAFGLKSRSVTAYPEAYQEVSKVFWDGLTKDERRDIAKVQAAAMEKVGFEPKTQKQFIEDFDPGMENRYGLANNASSREKIYISPKFYFAMVLILLGALLIFMSMPRGEPEGLLVTGIIMVAGGIALTLPIDLA